MRIKDITWVLGNILMTTIFSKWKHIGTILSGGDDYLHVEIDGDEYLITVNKLKKESQWGELCKAIERLERANTN